MKINKLKGLAALCIIISLTMWYANSFQYTALVLALKILGVSLFFVAIAKGSSGKV
jgi:uncharacterized membrane protein